MCRIIIARHGNTFEPDEPPRRIGARTDLPLVASGRAQATALGAHFRTRGLVFERCLTSPLLRTRLTAALVLDGAPCPVTAADWLVEIDHGPDEGRTEDEVRARVGAEALAAWERDATPPVDWRVDAVQRRAAWAMWFGDAAEMGGTVLVVTSNGAARFAAPGAGRLRTGSYGEVAISADAPPRIVAWDVRP
ncbi:histidine phosphatase family protein [Sphingomonas ginsenosidivorax]|uniref:Histidine phosphatase family protein n=1 Tax=Sphingomonas ginsenosidivorax TaxID=862135 RepID=A0A5C6UCX1_9SPHN|nr:histidine phosphatase family protein [Sphingomonas ginsenosidivorax]TXC69875.1 histidine phosphatase family protein [Sphingomonas ginsenosidivorax]